MKQSVRLVPLTPVDLTIAGGEHGLHSLRPGERGMFWDAPWDVEKKLCHQRRENGGNK